jgi:pantoate--beta-alanine ligase
LTRILSTVRETDEQLKQYREAGKRTGFVPTMGALHEGHLSLLRKAKEENDVVVCSIFVNPTQFNDPKDLEKYPRMVDSDIRLLESVSCDYAFVPSVHDVYPNGPHLLELGFGHLEEVMEGAFRPGHFRGMATVVKRLFDIVQPDRAYFGEKDFQQLAIVRSMVRQLELPIEVKGCPTLREADGLAMSSRNMLLTDAQRKAAPLIYKGMSMGQEYIPTMSPAALKDLVIRYIEQSPLLRVQYFEIVHSNTLEPVSDWEGIEEARACIAVLTDGPRLIDNMAYPLSAY